mgnify:CR=1 FL=1
MTVSSLVSGLKKTRIISIDPASHSLAWSILDIDKGSIKIVDYGKIDYARLPEMSQKFEVIKSQIPILCEKYKPVHAVIEQSVYIQNFQVSRILSYIIGFSWGILTNHCKTVEDVNPLKWKSGIGYKNVSKSDQLILEKEFGQKGIQKRLVEERKNRVKKILANNIPDVPFDDMDVDISDAIGIGLWYASENGYKVLWR